MQVNRARGRNSGMKRSTVAAAALLATLAIAAPASAGPSYTGDTEIPGSQPAGETLYVDAAVFSEGPVVPYEIAIQNECQLPNRGGRTVQRDDIVDWVDTVDTYPHTVMPVYLQAIPAGSKCKVFLMRGNTQLKGSVSSYTVD
jgi:hypothetical protein